MKSHDDIHALIMIRLLTMTEAYRYVDRDGVCAGWDCAVRSVEEYMSLLRTGSPVDTLVFYRDFSR